MNHAVLKSAAFVLTLTLLVCLSQTPALAQDPLTLNKTEALELISVTPNLLIIDLRDAEDFALDHVDGAVNIPRPEIEGRLDEFPTNRPILLYCYSGKRSAEAYAVLREQRPQITLLFMATEPLV